MIKSTSEILNRWAGPSNTAVRFTGLVTSSGTSLVAPATHPLHALFYGDSLTESVRTVNSTAANDTDRNDAMQGWAVAVGRALNAEYGIVGFGATGLGQGGSGGVPALGSSYALISAGIPRSFNPAPDLIVLNEGTNDQGQTPATFQALMQTMLTNLLTTTPPTTKIAVLRPFGGYQGLAAQAAVAAIGSSRVSYVDTSGFLNLAYGIDGTGLHPTAANDLGQIAPQVATALRPFLVGGGSAQRSYQFGP